MNQIETRGRRDLQRGETGPDLGELAELGGTARQVQAVRVGAARASDEPQLLKGLSNDTIVELTFASGARLWQRYEQLAADLKKPLKSRGIATETNTIVLPLALPMVSTRGGIADDPIELIQSFDIDLAGLVGQKTGKAAASIIAKTFDDRCMKTPGLWRWDLSSDWQPTIEITKPETLSGPVPLLVMIHGTASSTSGSFGALGSAATSAADAWRDKAAKALKSDYGDRMLALEHRTLSLSPVDNAISLVELLPKNATLHLVSHSRGGLVGELLCRAQRADGKLAFESEIEGLKRWAQDKGEHYGEELEKLAKLQNLLNDKHPKVERFVRVACPAAGTTLASRRLDRWLSMAANVLDLTGLGASFTYRFIKGFLLAVVKARTDPRDVPGLEAMLPGSLLTVLLNRPGVETTSDLSVISGDIEGQSLLARLALKFSDWYYGGNHDLIVDTVSMYGGTTRRGGARFYFDHGSEVNHFAYFRNQKTVEHLIAGLKRVDGDDADFTRLQRPKEIDDFITGRRDAGSRPTAFVLPGLMGSHLAVNKERIWIDLQSIAQGNLAKLAIGQSRVTADSLVAEVYGDLASHMSGSHDVKPFAYDWRRSLRETGQEFALALTKELETTAKPVRIIGHSSGGLVALAAFSLQTKLWTEFSRRDGCRLLLLGTPLRGSLAVARLLLNHDKLVKYLALLDFSKTEEELVQIFAGFPGVLELLPVDDSFDLLDPETWRKIKAAKGVEWSTPDPANLAEVREARKLIEGFPLNHERVIHVAGSAPATASGMEILDKNIRFFSNSGGDGRVNWTATPSLTDRVWQAPAAHGELATHAPSFQAYRELIETGSTNHLPTMRPPALGSPAELPADQPSIYPDHLELIAAALGFERRSKQPAQQKTELRLVHGNLGFARWPVMVGHYAGDTLSGSEAHLDRALDGRLARRRDLRIYPGQIETVEVVIDREREPSGAVVVGLGTVGDLSPGSLRRTLSYALRRYAIVNQEQALAGGGKIAVSAVAVGAGQGGFSVQEAVSALLEAIAEANAMLGNEAIGAVELLELYEDRAIQIARIISRLVETERLKNVFQFSGQVASGQGGRRRLTTEEDPSWWRRVRITRTNNGELNFNDLTDRARAEDRLVADQRDLVDRFVRHAVEHAASAADGFHPGSTLFELLLPPGWKETARSDRNLILVLDKHTAQYPWEMLQRGHGEQNVPISVQSGMVRQLIEQDFRDRPLMGTEDKALVIGDPPSGSSAFPPLKAAEEEARLVVELLRGRFAVTDRIGKDANPDGIISALMADRWRVLHLAGHGVFEESIDGKHKASGMVIGEGLLLTPQTIVQLPAVPEFVFINCCHLGRVKPTAEKKAESRLHELAANLATEFIKLGTRAVVAAGWAVDDAAAKLFAERLYQDLLAGISFGDAVHAARRQVYDTYQRTNTWGAYQCYGDHAFRLVHGGLRGKAGSYKWKYAHIREAILDIENVTQDSQTMAVRQPAALEDRLEKILREVHEFRPEWLTDSDFMAAAGLAFAELLKLDQAIECYETAISGDQASAPIRCVEQLANLRSRRAAIQRNADAAKIIQSSIAMIENLEMLAVPPQTTGSKVKRREKKNKGNQSNWPAQTSERLSILGSCYKRLARITHGKARKNALISMSDCYRAAFDRGQARSQLLPYPLLNWLLADQILALLDAKITKPPEPEDWLLKIKASIAQIDGDEPSFWNAITLGDVTLAGFINSDEANATALQAEVIEGYLKPWRRGASPLKFASVVEQMDFISDVLQEGPAWSETQRARIAHFLKSASTRLREETGLRNMQFEP